MLLIELLKEDAYYSRPVKKYWFNAETGEEIPVSATTHHSNFVVDNPGLFNLTHDEVDIIRNKDDDYNEDVVILVFQNRWVRVTYSVDHRVVWLTGSTLRDLRNAAKVYVSDETTELYLSNGTTTPISKRIFANLVNSEVDNFVNSGKLPDRY